MQSSYMKHNGYNKQRHGDLDQNKIAFDEVCDVDLPFFVACSRERRVGYYGVATVRSAGP